ncbi:hypothetical protein ARAM_005358 [Aspergillus rambellii]|uniref:Glucose N-acetyltransferase 1 n=1 Tax=Aspergillus rambellii TaxID=308745 RepID=A0A0F8WC67_9EURO|nr:hypothetical protein ARAM_005358 [Aspergillus rambellii]
MVLLTSSTVSVIVSSGVICIFTLLLFLSGYVLQQQSVRSIQHAIRPADSLKAHAPPPGGHLYRRSREDQHQDPLSYLDSASDEELASQFQPPENPEHRSTSPGGPGNYAYLQLLSDPDPSNICSAILFFKHLSTNGTAIQDRLFMYPQQWDSLPPNKLSQPVLTALALLRAASLKYGIWLLPIDMTAATSAGYTLTDTKLLRLGQVQFMQYDSVLYLQTPGLLLDTAKLDSMLLSRPLPLRHDKARVESYNNEAWIPMPLRAERDSSLPPVYLITVNNVENGHVEARGHIPNAELEEFGRLVTGPAGVRPNSDAEYGRDNQPGYVFFEREDDGLVKWARNPLFGSWRAQQYEICDGLDLDVIYDSDDDDDDDDDNL